LTIAAIVGGTAAAGSAVGLGWAFGMPSDVLRSLAPKSVTAPVAMGIAERIGGVPALSAVFAVATGLVGALTAKYLFQVLHVDDMSIRGFALGTASHGIGAARAIQVDANAGAYAGIALGLQVLLASFLVPLAFRMLT
jgi:putative effector of murein hydrolase